MKRSQILIVFAGLAAIGLCLFSYQAGSRAEELDMAGRTLASCCQKAVGHRQTALLYLCLEGFDFPRETGSKSDEIVFTSSAVADPWLPMLGRRGHRVIVQRREGRILGLRSETWTTSKWLPTSSRRQVYIGMGQ